MQNIYPEDRPIESGFGSAANIIHIAPSMSVGHAYINSNRGSRLGTPEDETTTAHNDYIEGLEESLLDAKYYTANISAAHTDQTITALQDELSVEQKHTDIELKKIMTMMKAGMTDGGAPMANPIKRGKHKEHLYPHFKKKVYHPEK